MKKTKEEYFRLSSSKISTYKQCPKKYWYRYIKKVPPFDFWPAQIKGSFTHDVLEVWVKKLIEGQDPRQAMAISFEEVFNKEEYRNKKVERFMEEIKPWLKQALTDYLDKRYQPLKAEEEINFLYRGIHMTGRVDRIDHIDNSTIKIVDYKTVKNPKYLTKLQVGIYHMGVKYGSLAEEFGDKDVETSYILLRHDMKEVPYKFSINELDGILDEIEDVATQIQNESEWEAKPSHLCSWCDYFVPCTKEREEETTWW